MAEKNLKDLDQRIVGVIIGAVGVFLVVISLITSLRLTFLGIVGVIVGVIVYFVGVSNKRKWEAVKKDLYPENEDTEGENG